MVSKNLDDRLVQPLHAIQRQASEMRHAGRNLVPGPAHCICDRVLREASSIDMLSHPSIAVHNLHPHLLLGRGNV